jgi:hypothetical protein
MENLSIALGRFVEDFRARLLSIPESRASEKQYADKWSKKEILGHLIDSAANNHQRIVRMQEKPDIGAFTYAADFWVRCQRYDSERWADLIELWASLNRHIAHVIANVDAASLAHTCDMGYAKPATLAFVIEDYVRHARHHVEQIVSDVDARQHAKWIRRDPDA